MQIQLECKFQKYERSLWRHHTCPSRALSMINCPFVDALPTVFIPWTGLQHHPHDHTSDDDGDGIPCARGDT